MSMKSKLNRRNVLQAAGGVALSPSLFAAAAIPGPRSEGPNRTKICLEVGSGGLSAGKIDDAGIRRVKQLGVDYGVIGGPQIPWQEDELRGRIEKLKAGGLPLYNLMIGGFPNAIYGRPGRDEEIEKVQQSIRAAGKAGLPVVEYNFYAHRAMEGYYEVPGRAGSGYTGSDSAEMNHRPPLTRERRHNLAEISTA